jgi:hypothetical protein
MAGERVVESRMKTHSGVDWSVAYTHSPVKTAPQDITMRRYRRRSRENRRTPCAAATVTMLVFVCVYSLVAMAIAQGRLQEAGKLWQGLYYAIAGMAWILPLMPLIKWMERPDADEN